MMPLTATSEKLDVWAKSMFAVQRDLEQPAKDADGAVKGGKAIPYLSLPGLIRHLKPVLKDHSLFFTQDTQSTQGGTEIITTVWTMVGTDTTGPQWVRFGPLFMPHGSDAQATGSAITYGRRYHLLAVFGLAAEDDDGERASAKVEPPPTPSPVTREASSPEGSARGEGMAAAGGPPESAYGEGAETGPSGGRGEPQQPTTAPPSAALTEYLKQLRTVKGGPRRSLQVARRLYGEDVPALDRLTEDQSAAVLLEIQDEDRGLTAGGA